MKKFLTVLLSGVVLAATVFGAAGCNKDNAQDDIDPGKSQLYIGAYNGGYGDADKWPWIEKTIPVAPSNGYKMTDIYKYLYDAIRDGVPFPVKPEEAFAVIRTTAEIKRQNPQFPVQGDRFE